MSRLFKNLLTVKKQHLLVYFMIICIAAILAAPVRVGDGMEYIAMAKALSELRLPAYSATELQEFYQWSDSQPYQGFGHVHLELPPLTGFDGRQDFPHFWFYPLLSVPFWWTLKLLHLPVVHAFTLLNVTLLGIALRVGLSTYSPMALCLVIASPIIWFLNKAHTETFTFSLVIIGISLASRGNFFISATAFAIASTQNLPWIPLVFILCSLSIIQKTPSPYKTAISKKNTSKTTNLIANKKVFKYISAFLLILTIVSLHPVYYLIRIHEPTPQLASGVVESSFPSLTKYFAVLIDPNLGLIPNLPFQTFIAVFTTTVIILPTLLLGFFRRNRHILNSQIWFAFGFTLFGAWLLFAFAKTTNVNHGATLSISRYAIWLIPILLPYFYIFFHNRSLKNYWQIKIVNFSYPIIFLIYLVTHYPSLPDYHTYQSSFSKAFYNLVPCAYQPVPEVFLERNLHVDGVPEQSVANSSCSLSFVKYGIFPNNCNYTKDEKAEIEKNVKSGITSSWIIRRGTFNLCQPRVVPLDKGNLEDSPSLNFSNSNLLRAGSSKSFLYIAGLGNIEGTAPDNWRWALGSETTLVFNLDEPQKLTLSFKFDNAIDGQNVTVEFNGVAVATFNNLKKGTSVDRVIEIQASKGLNRITFNYKYWNQNQITFAPKDSRPMSVSFTRLLIKPADKQ